MREWPKIVFPRSVPERIYLRFGRWSARSYNFSEQRQEIGVSVYHARLCDGVAYLHHYINADDRESLKGRCVWAVTGTEVGIGSDGEPLLRNVVARPYAIDTASVKG